MSLEAEYHVIDLLPDFVLDALSDDETNQVVDHLAGCSSLHEANLLAKIRPGLAYALASYWLGTHRDTCSRELVFVASAPTEYTSNQRIHARICPGEH